MVITLFCYPDWLEIQLEIEIMNFLTSIYTVLEGTSPFTKTNGRQSMSLVTKCIPEKCYMNRRYTIMPNKNNEET